MHLPSTASRSSFWQLIFKLPLVQGYRWGVLATRPPGHARSEGSGCWGALPRHPQPCAGVCPMLPHGEVPPSRTLSVGAGLGRATRRGAGVPFPWLLAVPACLHGSRHSCLPCLSLVCFYGSEGAVLPQFPTCS